MFRYVCWQVILLMKSRYVCMPLPKDARRFFVSWSHNRWQSALNQTSQKLPGRQSIWDAEEIDVVLYANVLVTIYRFLPPEESVPLIKDWMEPTRSDAVKICAVRACLTLAQEVNEDSLFRHDS